MLVLVDLPATVLCKDLQPVYLVEQSLPVLSLAMASAKATLMSSTRLMRAARICLM